MRADVRIQHERRKTLALKATPKGLVALIPQGLAEDSPRVQRFIEAGLLKLETSKVSETFKVSPDELRTRVDMWAKRIGVQVQRVQIRAMRNKWASCSSNGTLTLNTDVLSLPLDLVDYVLCHDLLHLRVPDHGKGFRAMMGCYLRDWQRREMALAGYGRAHPLCEAQRSKVGRSALLARAPRLQNHALALCGLHDRNTRIAENLFKLGL